jgi:hypothetical protein
MLPKEEHLKPIILAKLPIKNHYPKIPNKEANKNKN